MKRKICLSWTSTTSSCPSPSGLSYFYVSTRMSSLQLLQPPIHCLGAGSSFWSFTSLELAPLMQGWGFPGPERYEVCTRTTVKTAGSCGDEWSEHFNIFWHFSKNIWALPDSQRFCLVATILSPRMAERIAGPIRHHFRIGESLYHWSFRGASQASKRGSQGISGTEGSFGSGGHWKHIGKKWRFRKMGTPKSSICSWFFMAFPLWSIQRTIQLLGYPHDYGTLQRWTKLWELGRRPWRRWRMKWNREGKPCIIAWLETWLFIRRSSKLWKKWNMRFMKHLKMVIILMPIMPTAMKVARTMLTVAMAIRIS